MLLIDPGSGDTLFNSPCGSWRVEPGRSGRPAAPSP